jgi:hypothetical protein
MPPPKPKSRKRLWLILAAVVLVLAVIIGVASQGQNQKSAPATQAIQQPTLHPTTAPTTKTTPKPTVQPTKGLAVTHGTPRIGGRISDFYGKYGQPNNQGIGNSETWLADQQQTVLVNASPNASGEVTYVSVTSSANWSNSQIMAYCSQFMPSDASKFNSDANYTDYHSSIGEIVVQLAPASCVITIAQQ